MANERKIPYIIEMIADDSQLRKQMRDWNWEDIMGSKGKGFADILGQEGKEAKEKIRKELGGLNIDWEKIFGSKKHMQQFEQGLARVLTKSHKALSALANDDADGLQKIMDYVTGLGEAFKSFGSDFKVDALTRNMGAFMKVFSSDKISKMTNNMDAFAGALDRVFGKDLTRSAASTGEAVNKVAQALATLGTDKSALNNVKQIRAELEKAVQNTKVELEIDYDKLDNATLEKKLREKLKISASDSIDLEGLLTQEWDNQLTTLEETQKLLRSLTGDQTRYVTESAKLIPVLKNILSLGKKAEELTGYSWIEGYSVSNFADESAIREEIKDIIATLNEELGKSKKQLQQATEALVSGLGSVNVKLKLDDADKASFEKSINDYITKLNSTSNINDVKIGVKVKDDGGLSNEEIDEKIKKAKEWRRQIVNALNAEKEDMPLYFGTKVVAESLYNELQEYFEANEIDIRLNKDIIVQQLKQAIEEGGLPSGGLGGGTISLDPKTLASAVATGLQGFFTGDFKPVDGEKKTVKGVKDAPKKTLFLDPQNEYNQEVAKTFKNIIDYALADGNPNKKVKGFLEDKLAGSDFWNAETKSVNLEQLANGSSIGLVNALSYITEKYGETLIDDFNQLIKNTGKNKLLTNFRGDLTELLQTQNIRQITGDEHEKDLQRDKLWKDYVKKGLATAGIGKLMGASKSSADELKLPETTEIDDLIEYIKGKTVTQSDVNEINRRFEEQKRAVDDAKKNFNQEDLNNVTQQIKDKQSQINIAKNKNDTKQVNSLEKELEALRAQESQLKQADRTLREASNDFEKIRREREQIIGNFNLYAPVVNQLETLKIARESITNVNDGAQKEQFLSALKEFTMNVGGVYDDLARELRQYSWGIDVKGFKNRFDIQSASGVDRLWRVIDGDDSRIQTPHLYRAPDSISNLIEQRPDRTDVLYRNTKVKNFVPKDSTSKRYSETTAAQEVEERIRAEEEEIKKWEDDAKSLRNRHINIKQEISQREDSIAAIEKNIQVLSSDNKKIAGARKRLQNRTEAFDRAEAEYNELEKARMQATVDYLDAQEHQRKVDSQGYKDIDYANSQIEKYKDVIQNPKDHLRSLAGTINKEGYFDRLEGSIYDNEHYNATYYRDEADEKIFNIRKEIASIETRIGQATNDEERNLLKKQLEKNKRELEVYEQTQQRFQQILDDIDRKRAGLTEQDRADFEADVKVWAKKQLEIAKSRRASLGEDPRDVAKAETQRAERNAQLLDAQTAIAKTARDKAQKELDSVQDDEWIKRVKQIDEQTKRMQDMKEENERQKKKFVEIEESLRKSVRSKPQSVQKQIDDSAEKIDDMLEAANTTQENLNATIAEAKSVEQWVDDAVGTDGYKKVKYDIKHTKKNQELIDKTAVHRNRASYLSDVANDTLINETKIPDNLTEEMSNVINSLIKNREIIQKLSSDFGFEQIASEDELKNEVQRRLTDSTNHEIDLHPIIKEYYQKIINEGREMASQWLTQTLDATTADVETQKNKLQFLSEVDTNVVQALKPKLDEAGIHLRETYQKKVASWFNAIDKKMKIVQKGEAEGASEEAKRAGALAAKEIEDIYALINQAIHEYVNYFETPDYRRKLSDLGLKYREIPLTEAEKSDPDKRKIAENRNKSIRNQYSQAKLQLGMEEHNALKQELLGDNQSVMDSRNQKLYSDYIANITASSQADADAARAKIESSERYNLLLARQSELLAEISATTLDGKNTDELKQSLENINSELLKYQQYLTNVSEDIIKMEQKVALDRALGVPKEELDKQYSAIDKARADADKAYYDGLKKRQTNLLAQIKTNTKEGKSTTSLNLELEAINKELLEVETTQRRIGQLGADGDLYKADVFTVERYNELIKEQIKLEQELALIKAQGGDASQAQKDLRKQKNAVKTTIQQYQEAHAKGDAANSPYVQALDYIRETQEAYEDALQKRYTIKGRKSRLERQLDDVQNDDAYSTSWQYRKHQREVKDRLVSDYVSSDQYQTDKDAGLKIAYEKFSTYLEETFGAKKAEEIYYEFTKNQKGKHADKFDSTKFTETYGKMMRDGLIEGRVNAENEFKSSQVYQDLVAQREAIIKPYQDALAQAYDDIKNGRKVGDADLQQKINAIDQELAENIAYLTKATTEDYPLLEAEVKRLLEGADPKNNREYEAIVEKARNNLIKQEQNRASELKITEAYKKFQPAVAAVEKETQAILQNATDDYVRKYFDEWIEKAEDTIFQTSGSADVAAKFRRLLEENVYNLVSNYAESLVVKGGKLNGVDIRAEVEKQIQDQIDILNQHSVDAEQDIANIEAQRRAAMKFGGIKTGEIADAEILREQAVLEGKLTLEKERQKELTDEIARLEKEGASSQELGRLGAELDKSNENIRKLEMFVANKDVLMDIQHQALKDEKTLEQLDLDQQKLYYEARKTAAEADLESGNENVRKSAEERLVRLNSIIERLDGKIAERDQAERDAHNPIKMFAGAIKEALGGAGGGLNIDATGLATEATLAQILAALTGGKVVGSARSEVAATIDKKSSEWKTLEAKANEVYQKAKNTKDKNWTAEEKTAIETTIKSLIEKIQDPKTDEKTKLALQVALKDALGDFAKANKGNKKLSYMANGRLPYEEMDKYFGLTEGTLKNLRMTNDQAMKKLIGQPQAQPKMVEAGEGGVNAIAREDTLSKILEVLNAFKSDGVKVVGKKQTETKEKAPKVEKTEAELIRDRATSQKDAVLASAAGKKGNKGSLYDQFVRNLDELDAAVTEANKASDKDKENAIATVKAKAQKVSALSYNILKNTSEWDYITAQSDVVRNISLTKGQKMTREKMESEAKKAHGILGSKGGEKKNPKYRYDFLGFDGDTLNYQLTDIEGNVRKVTMVWNEFNKQVAITSDKTGSKLTDLAQKVESFGEAFENAIDAGHLAENDETLKRFKDAVAKIKTEIGKGTSFDDIDKLRNEALRIADEVTKKVNKVKRSYSGTTEINAAIRQHDNMAGRGMLDRTDLVMIEQYDKAYSALINKFELFKKNGALSDPQNQKALQSMAIQVKDLGKQLEKSVAEAEQLKQLVENSGTYKGKQMGGVRQVTDQETKNLEASMRSYLQTLGLGNIEHVKYDHVHQKLTGTLRTSNKTVADLEVKYNEATRALYAYTKAERESLTGVPAFINGFQKKFNSIMQYLTMTMSIHRIFSELRRGVQYIKEIDLALTELRKVTDETEETYDKFLETASKTGAKLGATISAVTEATATFAKLGYSIKDATEMAEAAIVYKNVGDNIASTGDAADSIISTMKGFGMEASEAMRIVDSFNEVGNKFAITSQGIGEALKLSASALNEGGNSLHESIALITAANEVVNDPSSVGTALKTLTLRLRGSKTELEEMGEDVSDMATTTSQLQAKLLALTGGKVDIMLDANTFKNSTQILREMADAWEDMNDIQRAEWCPYVQKCA